MTKTIIRKTMISKLNNIDNNTHEKKSSLIASRLYGDNDWKNAKVIGITISRFPEVETKEIIKQAWDEGKLVGVPKCNKLKREMTFRLINDFTQLETVYYGLEEPIENKTVQIEKDAIDLLVVPGVVYRKDGYRIGFGGGYYDRYLKDYDGRTISLAFSLQIEDDFPIEEHDVAVQKIITDNEVYLID